MGLNISKGNMYEFVTHTWNVMKGECFHNCSYCYMKRFGTLNPLRFDKKELKTDLGKGNFIFVGSSCDMFADNIADICIEQIIDYCKKFDNQYLLQTKNPGRYHYFDIPNNFILGTTIETNRYYECMGNTPTPEERSFAISQLNNRRFITIEPILNFDVEEMAYLINSSGVEWVNIGADSGNNNLPEPPKEKIDALLKAISGKIVIKKNMRRITGNE